MYYRGILDSYDIHDVDIQLPKEENRKNYSILYMNN